MYKLELHMHSEGVSLCSDCSIEYALERYKKAGYQGVVLTNHINNGTYRDNQDLPWPQKVDYFMADYYKMKELAGEDFDVLLGCEINLTPISPDYQNGYIPNDYLVYGVTEEWLRDAGDVRLDKLDVLSRKVHDAGMLFVHAHQFRYNTRISKDEYFDGYEVYNANDSHDSHDALADLWAIMKHKIRTSGSDFHHPNSTIAGGIETQERVRDNETLLRVLRSGNYELLRPDAACASFYLK